MLKALIHRWHGLLNMKVQKRASWYRERVVEELRERHRAKNHLSHLSETSDVLYSLGRAQHDGHKVRTLHLSIAQLPALLYMVLKYSSRWYFYRAAAAQTTALCKTSTNDRGRRDSRRHRRLVGINEVVNPSKNEKIRAVAQRNELDVEQFTRVCIKLRRYWPLLP